jgi:DNA-binding protein H-NS
VEYENLTVDQIRQQLAEIEQSKTELERVLDTRRHEARQDVVQQIRELIISNGYDMEEILPMVPPKRRRGAPAGSRATPPAGRDYTRYVDPENPENVYVRGVLPGWMKQKMHEQGYDPGVKADREAFKANYLQVKTA